MIPEIGLGAMRLSELDEAAALRLLHEAFDRGVRFFDTADVYAPSADDTGHNERLLAKALAGRDVTVATKGGLRREGKKWMPDGRARHLKAACEASLKALGVDVVDLYQLHASDPKVPFATSLRALASLQKQGKLRRIGLCNVRLQDIEAAREIVDIDAVQVELSPLAHTPLKNGVVAYCARHGIRVVAHSPLGGHRRTKRLAKLPLFQTIAERHGVSAHEIALVWLFSIDPVVMPIPGATRLASLVSSLHALDVRLTDDDIRVLDEAVPAGRVVRAPPLAVAAGGDREVVLFVGFPGAGKSTLARSWDKYVRLNRDAAEGYRLIRVTYRPGASAWRSHEDIDGIEIDVMACIHPPGPAVCWCRKPLPGLGVVAADAYDLDPARCIVVGTSAADRGFADRLGMRYSEG